MTNRSCWKCSHIVGRCKKKRSEISKLGMAEAMAEETRLNHICVIEQSKEDRDERQEQSKYNRHQRDQHHTMEMARRQAILNQEELFILQTRERLLQVYAKISWSCQLGRRYGGYLVKKKSYLDR